MAQQQMAGIAVLVALAFLAMAVGACANMEQVAVDATPAAVVAIPAAEEPPAIPEFHGADIGSDFLRSRLHAE